MINEEFEDELEQEEPPEQPVKKPRGRPKGIPHPKNENYDFSYCEKKDVKSEFHQSLKAEDVLLNRPARRPSRVEQMYREELLREELRKINNDRTWYFLVSGAMVYMNITSYRTIAVQSKESFLAYNNIKNLFGNPESFAILTVLRIEKDEYEIFNRSFHPEANINVGII